VHIEVVYALPAEQERIVLDLAPGATVRDAIEASGLTMRLIDAQLERMGIWGRPVSADTGLREGDRVEIYRPLSADPKDVRRKRAAKAGKS